MLGHSEKCAFTRSAMRENDMEIPTLEFEPQAQSLMIPLTNSDENSPSNLLQAKAKERVKYCESSIGNEFPEENQDLTVNNETFLLTNHIFFCVCFHCYQSLFITKWYEERHLFFLS